MTDKDPNVEIAVGERFQGGYCRFWNHPLPSLESCEPCIHCGKREVGGGFRCRAGAHMYP